MIGLIDIGGTKLLAATADGGPSLGRQLRRQTPRAGDMVDVVVEMLDEVCQGAPLSAIAASVPGPFDRAAGALLNPPGMAAEWHGLDLAGPLAERFACPVRLENDANCAALAEARLGAGRDGRLVMYYTVSTGVGSGLIRDGRLVTERHDHEGGHQVLWPERRGGPRCDCGGSGCLEAIASGRAIERRFGQPAAEITDQAVWDDIGNWLGIAVVNAVALLDCDCVVFGGGIAGARWGELEPGIRGAVAEHLHLQPPPHIHPAELGEDRNLHGALLVLDQPPSRSGCSDGAA